MEVKNLDSNPNNHNEIDSQIEHDAIKLSKEKLPYNYLCGILANLILEIEKGSGKFSKQDIIKKKEEIIKSMVSYDEICELISKFKVFTKKHLL